MPKRNDRVAPPAPPGGWEVRFADKAAVDGWEDLCRLASANVFRAWEALAKYPETPINPDRQHPLKGELGSRQIGNKNLVQWQYEVTGAGRLWYCPDAEDRTVWLTLAKTGHPKKTDRH